MKKLLFVTSAIGYGIGGSEKALIEMLKKLDLTKYSITVLSLKEKTEKKFERNGISVVYGEPSFLRLYEPFTAALRNIHNYKFRELMAKLCVSIITRLSKRNCAAIVWKLYKPYITPVNEDFDVVIGYGPGMASFYAMDKTSCRRKILWVDTDIKKAHMDINYLKSYYLKADSIVLVSDGLKKSFLNIYPEFKDKSYVVRNILDVDEITKKSKEQKGFDDVTDSVRILSVGRLTEAKAFHYAIEAASILKRDNLMFKWYIIGFGELEHSLKNLANKLDVSDRIVFLGQQFNPYPFFSGADIYVQTSIFEGSCITLEEALVFKKPIVTTNFPAVFEKIIDGKNGFIVDMCSSAIAEAVKKLITNEDIREQMIQYQAEYPLLYNKEIDKFDYIVNEITSVRNG